MEWAISTNSANILTHLRDLGYPIPFDIIEKYPLVIRDYLLGKLFPLQPLPPSHVACAEQGSTRYVKCPGLNVWS